LRTTNHHASGQAQIAVSKRGQNKPTTHPYA
jgi:hypothetical protein